MRRLTAAALFLLAGCTTDRGARTPLEPPDTTFVPTPDFTLEHSKNDGDFSYPTVGTTLPLRARVMRNGLPVRDILVTWRLSTALPGTGLQFDSVKTDQYGYSITSLKISEKSGGQVVLASIPGSNLQLSYVVIGEPDAPFLIDARLFGINDDSAALLVQSVKDRFDNEIYGADVTWTVLSGRALLSPNYDATRLSTWETTSGGGGGGTWLMFSSIPDSDQVSVTTGHLPPKIITVSTY
jgi:hypothetical protein